MKQSVIKTAFLLALAFSAGAAVAQQAFVPCGRISTGSGGSFSFSVGQPAVLGATNEAGTVRLSEGVVQPLMVEREALEGVNPLDVAVSVGPNPTAGLLRVVVEGQVSGALHYELLTLNGQRLRSGILGDVRSQIDLSAQAAGVYLLLLYDDGGRQSRFRIVKA